MEDVKTMRRTAIASDHHLLVAKMKLNIKKDWTSKRTTLQTFNAAFLRDNDKLNKFKIALGNRFLAFRVLFNRE
ncbi:unnamed protein product [Schistosoma margrebowiei]|uniref:Uncharacterized protein n=1 Tax=Schistosoma margrebowiei TaxID=48269 RepID=A0A183MVZ5_9TREM|nr:unnamed protein product [Schistosoma margrebowiei]